MSDRTRTLGAALALVFAMALTPVPSHAQGVDQPWSIDARGGIGVPAGDLSDLADVGPSFGLGVAYKIHPRIALRVDGDLDIYSGADFESQAAQPQAPDLNLWHYSGGVEFEITRPGASRWDVTANLGAGATTVDGDAFTGGPVENPNTETTEIDFNETYFTANGGLKVGYDVHRNVNVYAGGQWFLTFADEDDTAVFDPVSGGEVQAFDTMSSIPLTLGVKLKF